MRSLGTRFKSQEAQFGQGPNDPFGRISAGLYPVSIIPLKFVMIIMIAFPHGENGGNPTVPSTVAGGVGPLSNHVTKGIDAESGVLNHATGSTGNQ